MGDWLKKYRITKKYVAMFEKLENAYASASDSVNNSVDREKDERRRDKWQCIAQIAEIEKNQLSKQRQLRQENTLSDAMSDANLAHLYAHSQSDEKSQTS